MEASCQPQRWRETRMGGSGAEEARGAMATTGYGDVAEPGSRPSASPPGSKGGSARGSRDRAGYPVTV